MHKVEGPNSVEFRIPVMIYPLDNYNYKVQGRLAAEPGTAGYMSPMSVHS